MIHVRLQPEPGDFDSRVRIPGTQWRQANPGAAPATFPPFWRDAMPALRQSYKGICAYYCCFVMPATGGASTDHFAPKSKEPADTYEWSNYRFACTRMNSRKSNASDVLDPFTLADGCFALVFHTMRVVPAAGVTGSILGKVNKTVNRLNLNSTECIDERTRYWNQYQRGLHVEDFYQAAPFIALEAVRQGMLLPAHSHITVAEIRAWLDA